MGNTFTINMEENFKKNQEFITEMNTIKVCYNVCGLLSFLLKYFFLDWKAVANEEPNEGKRSGFTDCKVPRTFFLVWCLLSY